jgi:hypothetical protein
MLALRRGWVALAVALAGPACSDDVHAPARSPDAGSVEAGTHDAGIVAVPDGHADAGIAVESGATVTPAADGAATDSGDVPFVPTNTSFDTATPVVTGKPALQDVVAGKQKSYFSFEGKAGAFYSLSTEVSQYSPNNVLFLYDADQTLIAQNDDGARWPGDSIDARLVVRLPHDGTYYAMAVDETLTDDYFPPGAFVLVYYHLTLDALVEGPGVGTEGHTAVFAHDDTSGYSYATLIGEFHADEDTVFPFTGVADQALIGRFLLPGKDGDGSTALGGRAQVTTSDGHVVASIDRARGQADIHPPVAAGTYSMAMSPVGELGDNAFVAADVVMLAENPRETASTTNDTVAGAEAMDMKGSLFRRGLILSTLGAKDVDYFKFDANEGESVLFGCEAESAGSGVTGLSVEFRDAADAALQTATETVNETVFIQPSAVPKTGTYYLRLSSAATVASTTEPWVRCVVSIGP